MDVLLGEVRRTEALIIHQEIAALCSRSRQGERRADNWGCNSPPERVGMSELAVAYVDTMEDAVLAKASGRQAHAVIDGARRPHNSAGEIPWPLLAPVAHTRTMEIYRNSCLSAVQSIR